MWIASFTSSFTDYNEKGVTCDSTLRYELSDGDAQFGIDWSFEVVQDEAPTIKLPYSWAVRDRPSGTALNFTEHGSLC